MSENSGSLMNTSMFKNNRLGHWHMQHRPSRSELFDTFTDIILLRIFPL
jgi:hypothetical protein